MHVNANDTPDLAGPISAWRWSPNPLFTFAAVRSADGGPLLQINVRGPYDQELVMALLEYARDRSSEFISGKRQLGVLEGFRGRRAGARGTSADSRRSPRCCANSACWTAPTAASWSGRTGAGRCGVPNGVVASVRWPPVTSGSRTPWASPRFRRRPAPARRISGETSGVWRRTALDRGVRPGSA